MQIFITGVFFEGFHSAIASYRDTPTFHRLVVCGRAKGVLDHH
jgi:hypothetical protein